MHTTAMHDAQDAGTPAGNAGRMTLGTILTLFCLLLPLQPTLAASDAGPAPSPAPAAGSGEKDATAPAKDTPVAVVAGRVLTAADLERELELIRQRFAARGRKVTDAQLDEVRDQVLDRMVRRELLYQASKEAGITVSPAEIDKGYQMVRARYATDEEFQSMLQRLHFTEQGLKEDIARETAIKKFIDSRFVQNTTVSDEEARAYYDKTKENFRQPESVRASHILVKVAADADEQARKEAMARIKEIKQQLDGGAEFAELARKYSEGPSAKRGGDLGFFQRGQMVKPFEEVAFSLEPGTVSDVVTTRFGYHLIKVEEHIKESVVPFEAIKDRIKEYLKREKIQKQVNAYLDGLRKKMTVTIM